MFKRIKSQRGATLVGVLIAMVVAGIGLYALMQTQGKMTGGISASKARAEAMQVAQKTAESLRAYIHSDQFDTDLTIQAWGACNSVTNPVNGVNADFTVQCRVAVAPDDGVVGNPDGNYKQLLVRVNWTDEAGKTQHVFLNNFIVFNSPALSTSIKDAEGSIPPSTLARRGRWGDERAEKGTETEAENDERIVSEANRLLPGVDLFKRTNSKGHWELYVYNNGTPYVVLTAFGGILHQLRGKIHFQEANIKKADLENMAAIASSPAYCAPLCVGDCSAELAAKEVEYHCFVPGSCENETSIPADSSYNEACKYDETGVINNSAAYEAHIDEIKALDLGGGWYGRVGLFGIPEKPFDDIITGDSCEDPARFYASIRLQLCTSSEGWCTSGCGDDGYISHMEGSGANEIEVTDGYCISNVPYEIYENEGINGSYSNNHFWLIDGDLNTKSCSENLATFSQSATIAEPTVRTDPAYLVDHRLPRLLRLDDSVSPPAEPPNVITVPDDMGLDDHTHPPAP